MCERKDDREKKKGEKEEKKGGWQKGEGGGREREQSFALSIRASSATLARRLLRSLILLVFRHLRLVSQVLISSHPLRPSISSILQSISGCFASFACRSVQVLGSWLYLRSDDLLMIGVLEFLHFFDPIGWSCLLCCFLIGFDEGFTVLSGSALRSLSFLLVRLDVMGSNTWCCFLDFSVWVLDFSWALARSLFIFCSLCVV